MALRKFIIERDIPAAGSLDREQRVIYLGTFSKIMMPSLRLGYLVASEDFIAALQQAKGTLQPTWRIR